MYTITEITSRLPLQEVGERSAVRESVRDSLFGVGPAFRTENPVDHPCGRPVRPVAGANPLGHTLDNKPASIRCTLVIYLVFLLAQP